MSDRAGLSGRAGWTERSEWNLVCVCSPKAPSPPWVCGWERHRTSQHCPQLPQATVPSPGWPQQKVASQEERGLHVKCKIQSQSRVSLPSFSKLGLSDLTGLKELFCQENGHLGLTFNVMVTSGPLQGTRLRHPPGSLQVPCATVMVTVLPFPGAAAYVAGPWTGVRQTAPTALLATHSLMPSSSSFLASLLLSGRHGGIGVGGRNSWKHRPPVPSTAHASNVAVTRRPWVAWRWWTGWNETPQTSSGQGRLCHGTRPPQAGVRVSVLAAQGTRLAAVSRDGGNRLCCGTFSGCPAPGGVGPGSSEDAPSRCPSRSPTSGPH